MLALARQGYCCIAYDGCGRSPSVRPWTGSHLNTEAGDWAAPVQALGPALPEASGVACVLCLRSEAGPR